MYVNEKNIVNVKLEKENKITICGDIHGQYYDLLNIWKMNESYLIEDEIFFIACYYNMTHLNLKPNPAAFLNDINLDSTQSNLLNSECRCGG